MGFIGTTLRYSNMCSIIVDSYVCSALKIGI